MIDKNTDTELQLDQRDLDQRDIESSPEMRDFDDMLKESSLFPLKANGINVLQINVGFKCNQACKHCHVSAGPSRSEQMSRRTFEHCLRVLREGKIPTVDITGGAPELNPHFRWFVKEARDMGIDVINRCNLTVVFEPGQEDTIEFLARHKVSVIASLPAISASQTDAQRGKSTFGNSIEALKLFNQAGYGLPETGLEINLVTNPVGAFMPASQATLEDYWKRVLGKKYGIKFNHLFTITNMPVGRFLNWLKSKNLLDEYMKKLTEQFNPKAVSAVMCKSTLSIDWQGYMYDCDFNQMLGLRVDHGMPVHISEFDNEKLNQREIVTKVHCFGCTAGNGSSCGGEVV